MTAQFTIPASTLQAALLSVAKKDVRYYLNGVYLDLPAGLIVSTDGHRCFIGKLPDDAPRSIPPVIVPSETVTAALKGITPKMKRMLDVLVTINGEAPARTVSFTVGASTVAGAEIDGRFPDYARIVPVKCSGEVGTYNPDYLADARDALNWYTGNTLKACDLWQNGTSGAVAHMGADVAALVVIMPTRAGDPSDMPDLIGRGPVAVATAA